MKVIHAQNVNDALVKGIQLVKSLGVNISPRGMKTLEVPTPVSTVYSNPWERVLMYPERDANPFFHFFEGLWMLAGREDVAFLAQFNSNIANYSDDGKVFHAPYGYRLRKAFGRDQLQLAIDLLLADQRTRQVVLQIWDASYDLGTQTKDIPCNDLIFLKVRHNHLNMTVCCRSNDILWGCYGANAVHFSMIHEYLARRIGCHMGSYTQISDSFHAYVETDLWKKLENLETDQPYQPSNGTIRPFPLVTHADSFDGELVRFMCDYDDELISMFEGYRYKNHIFPNVAVPMWKAYQHYKKDRNIKQAIKELDQCLASDWKKACTEWMTRRIKN